MARDHGDIHSRAESGGSITIFMADIEAKKVRGYQLGCAAILLVLTALFATEPDTGYYWVGADLIRRGLVPYRDFFQFQYPPGAVYLLTPFYGALGNILVQRFAFLGVMLVAIWLVFKALARRQSGWSPFEAFSATVLLLAVSHDFMSDVIEVDSKTCVAAASLLVVALLGSADLARRQRDSRVTGAVLVAACFFVSQKLLNGFILASSFGCIFVIDAFVAPRWRSRVEGQAVGSGSVAGSTSGVHRGGADSEPVGLLGTLLAALREPSGKKTVVYLAVAAFLCAVCAAVVFISPRLRFQGFDAVFISLLPVVRFKAINLARIAWSVLYYYGIPAALLWKLKPKRGWLAEGEWFWRVGVFVVVYVTVYSFAPPRMHNSYVLAPLLSLYALLGIALAQRFQQNPKSERTLLLLAPAALLLFTNTFAASQLVPWIFDTHNVSPHGGLYQYAQFHRIADFIRSHDAELNPDGRREYRSLRWPQPILMAGRPASVATLTGESLLFIHDPPDPKDRIDKAKALENHILTWEVLEDLLSDDKSAAWVLEDWEVKYVQERVGTKLSPFSTETIARFGRFGLYRLRRGAGK